MSNIFRETTLVLFNKSDASEIREISHAEKQDSLQYDTACAYWAQAKSSGIKIFRSGISKSPKIGYLPVTALINLTISVLQFVLLLKAKQQPSICRRVIRKVSYSSTYKENKGIMLQTKCQVR